ncbi:hypothetical protein MPSI1_001643 [Malassezia psittaci]|uniref:Uncharacterized protein n=1 Tax=Malassezia psittaci TaxID=1821823 RepID=A0AAF0F949_9BASI|nr:hypothetical protein MPSI1_001643 [Malassezia psittaci]
MKPPMCIALPERDFEEPFSVWSDDDEMDGTIARRAMDDWVMEVNKFLGGSARRSDRAAKINRSSGLRTKELSAKTPNIPTTPRAPYAVQKPAVSFRSYNSNSSLALTSPSVSSKQSSSGPSTPTVSYPYSLQPDNAPARFSLSAIPPRLPPPITPPPARPLPESIPEDVISEDGDDNSFHSLRISTLHEPLTKPVLRSERTVHFVDSPSLSQVYLCYP